MDRKNLFQKTVTALLVLLVLCSIPVLARAAGEAEEEHRPELVITVLGDIVAEDIDTDATPLTLFGSSLHGRIRHAVLMGITLLAVIGYVWYFSSYEKRLYLLRQTAAREEHRVMLSDRESREEAP